MKTEHRAWLADIPDTDGRMGIYVDGKLAVIYTEAFDGTLGDMLEDLERITKLVEDDPDWADKL